MRYGFTKKQVNVVYKAWKQGKIEADKHTISKMYDLAENGIFGRSASSYDMHYAITNETSLIIKGGYESAQREIDNFASELKHYEWRERARA